MPGTVPDTRDDGQNYGFSARNAERIATAVRRIEATYQNELPQRRQTPPGSGAGPLVPICITTNVIAGSRAVPSPFGCTVELPFGPLGFTVAGGALVTAYNKFPRVVFSASPAAPVEGWGTWFNGHLYLVVADCP